MPEYLVVPNEQQIERLFKEYGMTNEQVKRDVAIVRKWMLSQPHLPEFPESKNGNFFFFIGILLTMFVETKKK